MDNRSFFDPGGFRPVSVGRRIRQFRREKGLTIKDLAAKCGLAINTLSLIENDKSSANVNSLERIAKVLDISMALLFEPFEVKYSTIVTRAGLRREMWVDRVRVEDCGIALDGKPMQPFVVTLPPGEKSGSGPIHHAGYEFVYCLSGIFEYRVADQTYTLKTGDSLFFESQQEHECENQSESQAEYLLLMIPGDQRQFPSEVHFVPKN